MFLDGMGDQLSGLERDEAGGDDHAEGYPLDGVEDVAEGDRVGIGLAQEGEEELSYAGRDEGGGERLSGDARWAKGSRSRPAVMSRAARAA